MAPERDAVRRGALVGDPVHAAPCGRVGAVITLMGFRGGLVMSAIKRDRGVKDWGP